MNVFVLALIVFVVSAAAARTVTVSNLLPRVDTTGAVVNAHDGNIVYANGTYFLYGENYGHGNYVVMGNEVLPKLAVYTSNDMVTWEWQGYLHNNTNPTWAESGKWPNAPSGTWWSPWAVYDKKTGRIIIWFSASPGPCCNAYFGVAQSTDGIHFDLVTLTATPSDKSSVDGSAVFIDDDGVGYVAYTAMGASGTRKDHTVGIERLTPDYLAPAGVQVGPYLPDYFVEGVMLFKRGKTYYVMYGSCCCACREGSGAVVLSATSIAGPWTRQARDINCNVNATICAAGHPWPPEDRSRPTGQLTVSAQGIGISMIPNATDGTTTYLWSGGRWLSAPNNPPKCYSLCLSATGECAQSPAYDKGADFDYWIPLQFGADGQIGQFGTFVDAFQLNLPN